MYISQIRIKGFRSIQDEEILLKPINLLVGYNDSGKSNILKALNLFFNGQTDHGKTFHFDRDYCTHTIQRKGKAPEIEIAVKFKLPSNYSVSKEIEWVKRWRKGTIAPHYDQLGDSRAKTKTSDWIKKIRYRYVPAVKGPEYFQTLLVDLHDTLASAISGQLKDASSGFLTKLRKNTERLTIDVQKSLGLKSEINLPMDLGDIFQVLEFETDYNGKQIALRQRGDGIQARHIPIILKFISILEKENGVKGSPRSETVWGYEEPENNLELTSAFDLASNFNTHSKDIQLLITTHSPAFYSLEQSLSDIQDKDKVQLIYISQGNQGTKRETESTIKDCDERLGLLPLVSKYVSEKEGELKQVKSLLTSSQLRDHSKVLFCEGETDELLLTRIFSGISDSPQIRAQSNAGHNWIADNLKAWAYSRNSGKAIGLFDSDGDAKKSCNNTNEYIHALGRKNAKGIKLLPPDKIKKILQFIKIDFAIEAYYPQKVWLEADSKGWLEDQTGMHTRIKNLPNNISVEDYVSQNVDLGNRIYLKKVKLENKRQFFKHAEKIMKKSEDPIEDFEALRNHLNAAFSQES